MIHRLIWQPALALCLLAGLSAAPAAAALGVDRQRTIAGDWRLDVSRDRFSQQIICRLRARGGALVEGNAVGFRFKRSWDVSAAVYRIDGGTPRQSRDDRPELLRLGTPMETGGITNPTDGVVWIPLRLLADANAVAIKPQPGRRPKVFHFSGLRGLYQLAHERGCMPDSRFVR